MTLDLRGPSRGARALTMARSWTASASRLDAWRCRPYLPRMVERAPDPSAVVIFDGECAFCDAAVNFIIDRDVGAYFRFASRQSPAGKRLLQAHGLPAEGLGSLVLIEAGDVHVRSTASLRIARRLSGPWPIAYAFVVVPAPLRDGVYGVVSRNRKRWMGESQSCAVPSPERRARYLSP